MLAFGSSWSEWNKFNAERTLAEMGRDEIEVKVDVEEGEISDSASVEEISEEDFNNQEVRILKESKPNGDLNPRVWTMRDLYNKYPSICRGYTSGLYNLAWAQAVQNKPLCFGAEVEKGDNLKRSSPLAASLNDKSVEMDSAKEVENVVIDDSGDEKEEGELEEGEIDLDFEPVEAEEVKEADMAEVSSGGGNDPTAEFDLSKQVSSIRGVLEGLTASEAEKSFEEVCSKLESTLPNLRDLIVVNEMAILTDPGLIKLAFGAINSVFFYVNSRPDERNKGILSRLLSSISGYEPPLFSLDHKKEIEKMRFSLESSTRTIDKEKEKKITDGISRKDSCSYSESMGKAFISVEPIVHNKSNTLNTTAQPGMSGFRTRGALLPLLDLHKDHDADSLPSPTREMTPPVFAHKSSPVGDGALKSPPVGNNAAHGAGDTKLHPYETDALKAVSTYQQKFGRGSMFLNELPSPTPSEESGDEGGDTGGDVSSSLIGVVKPSPAVTVQPIVSAPSQAGTTNFGMQGPLVVQNAPPTSSGAIVPSKSCAKSRDPRLRFAFADSGSFDSSQRLVHNASKSELVSGFLNSRKQKNIDETALDGPKLKKQKNEMETFKLRGDVPSISGSGGWLEGNDAVGTSITNKTQPLNSTEQHSRIVDSVTPLTNTINGRLHMTSCGNEQSPVMTASTLTSLPALLKDIAVNPTMLLNLLKMSQQQKSATETQQSSAESVNSAARHPSSNAALGAVPSVCFPPVNPGNLHKPAGSVQIASQSLPADDSGKIRMKPRDPRRNFHGNMLQRNSTLGMDQFKSNGLPALNTQGSNDIVNAEKTEIQPPKHLQSPATSPNIARQFTKNLKNIADILSVSQTSTAPQAVSANEISPTVHKEERTAVAVQTPEIGTLLPRPPNAWGDVDDLFEGYDDKQKAAIQRERARRIEEQKKMFASRKLCLVLDLDHTLLNSAKFHEVDPVHQDILRKKEEQDREKSQRHLFRFPHMGMWTKLRPGIWNFLEKASKLYELHLYTMGNRLYATEMAKVLDPKGVLFAGRVISRGDDGDLFDGDERVPKSKDLEGVLGMESAVVIIDDSVRVWPHNKLNLIVVERYTYFPCSRRQFGLLGPSLLEIDHDERSEDGTLASSLAVIERLHKNFFSNQNLDEVDVRNILASEQRRILGGCRIVFSRVFPVGEANPHMHPLWQTAEQFGATCTNQIDEQVTHVVANSLGTDKVNWALSTGRFVVHPGWVEASALLYRRANEVDFAIKS